MIFSGFKVTLIPNHEANQGCQLRALRGFTPTSVLKRISGDGLVITACHPDPAAATDAHIPVAGRVHESVWMAELFRGLDTV